MREVVAQERGELEEAKERLLLGLAADTRQLHDLQDRILKLLKVCAVPLCTTCSLHCPALCPSPTSSALCKLGPASKY